MACRVSPLSPHRTSSEVDVVFVPQVLRLEEELELEAGARQQLELRITELELERDEVGRAHPRCSQRVCIHLGRLLRSVAELVPDCLRCGVVCGLHWTVPLCALRLRRPVLRSPRRSWLCAQPQPPQSTLRGPLRASHSRPQRGHPPLSPSACLM